MPALRRLLSPGRLLGSGLLLLALVVVVSWLAPSGYYLFLPDPAHPVAPLLHVPGGQAPADGGGIYFVDVVIQKATLFERLFPGIHDGSTLAPAGAVNPTHASDAAQRRENLRAMRGSQSVAAATALQELGHPGLVHPAGVRVDDVAIDVPAARVLRPGDVILGVNGRRVRTSGVCGPGGLRGALRRTRPGSVVTLRVHRGGRVLDLRVRTVAAGSRAIIGIDPETIGRVDRLPVPVLIESGRIGGPSAGLAFTLGILERLGRDVDHGLKVAATGTIEPDGCVGSIGGVKQKTLGARAAHVDVFLVPAGDNAREAMRYAAGLRIVPVHSFRQALQALATIPRSAKKA